MKYTAIVLAGSRPGPDPFAKQFGNDIKALIAVGGEPMVRRPVRALLASPQIGEVIVLAQETGRLADVIPSNPHVMFQPSSGTIAETMLAISMDPRTPSPDMSALIELRSKRVSLPVNVRRERRAVSKVTVTSPRRSTVTSQS